MFLTILGKRWRLRFVPRLGRTESGAKKIADCDSPTTPGKMIRIEAGTRGRLLLDTLIHEMLHAGNWSLDEAHVEQLATDIAAALWKVGYRRCE